MKILVLGHARHGKDTVAEYLASALGLTYKASSEVCAGFIAEKMGYDSVEECFEDRVNHRAAWHQHIADYCKDDKAKLGRLIFSSNDIYCGVRAQDELDAIIEEFKPIVIWVDAMARHPAEDKSSMQLEYQKSWIWLNNNGAPAYLYAILEGVVETLRCTNGRSGS